MIKLKNALKSYDYLLALTVIAIGAFGVVMIYAYANARSAPISVTNLHGGAWRRQLEFIISGTFLMIAASCIDYRRITKFYIYIYGFMMAFLVVVMFIGAGEAGVARWIPIRIPGIGSMTIQPSEFSKLFMILFLAKFLEVTKDKFNKIHWLGLLLVLITVPVLLVVLQPSLSASLVILSLSLVILFVAGLYYRTILVGILTISPIAILLWLDMQRAQPLFMPRILGGYQWTRIETWLISRFGDIYEVLGRDQFRQTQQSLYAISSGRLTGRGFMNNSFVTHGHNDFIFSLVAEQFGFVGAAILLAVIALAIIRCILISLRAADMQGRLIAAGVAGMLIFETFVHVSVTTNFLPNTGMPFPFLSFGGSMIWVHMLAMGIVLNVGLPRTKSMFDDEDEM